MKKKIELEGIITEDGNLLVQIPKNLSPGRVKITIDPADPQPTISLSREAMREKMAKAGYWQTQVSFQTILCAPTFLHLCHL